MGQDGLRGCEAVKAAGGWIVAQDEASSVVWGMPGFVTRAGLADRVLPLPEIAAEMNQRVHRSPARDASSFLPLSNHGR
jgi:two-component system chemotaxis response regulator CheB